MTAEKTLADALRRKTSNAHLVAMHCAIMDAIELVNERICDGDIPTDPVDSDWLSAEVVADADHGWFKFNDVVSIVSSQYVEEINQINKKLGG